MMMTMMRKRKMRMIEFDEVYHDFFGEMDGQNDAYKLAKIEHPLGLMLGMNKDFNPSLLFISNTKPSSIPNSSAIDVYVGLRKDKQYAIIFSLLNDKYIELFSYFCMDMINSSINCKKEDGAHFLCNRYLLWKKMLERSRSTLLTDNEVKGLIGELYFLKNFLFEKYGVEESIKSWMGPEKTDQDFMYKDTWFEVKAVSPGSTTIRISSVEQLDTNRDGNLVVLYLDKTSISDNDRLNLNKLVSEIKELILDESLKIRLDVLLMYWGYTYNDEYDNKNYHFISSKMYMVNNTFPCLRQRDLNKSIGKINYELITSNIEEWSISDGIARI